MSALAPPALQGASQDLLVRVRGTVQGVGFRPFVRQVACRLELAGWVRNDTEGVLIRIAGATSAVEALIRAITQDAPSAARVATVETSTPGRDAAPLPAGFAIVESDSTTAEVAMSAPPDLALCPECRRELDDPADRRFGYPFINCTQCGPRYSILERLPYDRCHTTMRDFQMCPQCAAEYANPDDRRYHAQPNACPQCGPQVHLTLPSGIQIGANQAIYQAALILQRGGILAVKGIGGYQLWTDARDEAAVGELRRRKGRDAKPFAVMFPDLASARASAEISPAAEVLLLSAAAPVVLVPAGGPVALAAAIAPRNPWLGVLLPSAPLQLLAIRAFGGPVVATSANLAGEPLCFQEHDAHRRLAGIADGFLEHNRHISQPVDDSVLRLSKAGPICLRRARGYAPSPLALPGRLTGSWLCVGAQMKNTVAAAAGDRVMLSPHLGDLSGAATRELYRRTVGFMTDLQSQPYSAVASDQHPDYESTRYAEATRLPRLAVQHHLAHLLACLVDNSTYPDRVLGVTWDGTGYGEDGTVWGGEFIRLENRRASRFARLRPFRLPGSEAAVRDGRRVALALIQAAGQPGFDETAERLGLVPNAGLIRQMLERGLNSPVTTSAGRLFDAVAALLELAQTNRYEGEMGLAVEAAASRGPAGVPLPLPLRPLAAGQGACCELDWSPLIEQLRARHAAGESGPALAAAFHRALADGIVTVARAAEVETVALSGGCFQNARLTELTSSALRAAGCQVLLHRDLPANDGNIAVGQALAALWNLSRVDLP